VCVCVILCLWVWSVAAVTLDTNSRYVEEVRLKMSVCCNWRCESMWNMVAVSQMFMPQIRNRACLSNDDTTLGLVRRSEWRRKQKYVQLYTPVLQLRRKISYRSIMTNRISIDMLEQLSSVSVITWNSTGIKLFLFFEFGRNRWR
jgi:hypothetical protein